MDSSKCPSLGLTPERGRVVAAAGSGSTRSHAAIEGRPPQDKLPNREDATGNRGTEGVWPDVPLSATGEGAS